MRLHLTVQDGTLAGQVVELETGELLIGRSGDCSLQFDPANERAVSNHHAFIRKAAEGFYLTDQNSTNGTLLNGKKVQHARLRSGDIVQLGTNGPKLLIQLSQNSAGDGETTLQKISTATFYDPLKEKQGNLPGTLLALGATAFLVFIVLLVLLASLGFKGVLVGAVMAFFPAPFYLFIYLWMDRYDPEPPMVLAASFAWGALFSILVSFIVNTVFGSVVASIAGRPAGMTLSAVLSAPIIEEFTKGLGVWLVALLFRKEFDGVLDGIVYAGVIGLGFATVENVLYYGGAFLEAGAGALLGTAFLRGVLSPFIHSFFTAMTGIGCGMARESHEKSIQLLMPAVGLFAAMFLHGLWNLCASLMGGMFFVAYFFVWVPLFFVFLGFVLLMAQREKKIIREALRAEEGALLTAEDVDLAGSLRKKFTWLLSSRSLAKFDQRRKYLRALTRLAFCYWHAGRATSAGAETISHQQIPRYRSQIRAIREKALDPNV